MKRPRFFSSTSGVFEVVAGRSVVYATTNGGANWRPSISPGCCEFFFLGANQGWALALGQDQPASQYLFATSDAGQHWRVVHPHMDAQTKTEASQHFVTLLSSMNFVTLEIGYVLRFSGQPVLLAGPTPTPVAMWSQSLLKTTDGGASWTEVRTVSS